MRVGAIDQLEEFYSETSGFVNINCFSFYMFLIWVILKIQQLLVHTQQSFERTVAEYPKFIIVDYARGSCRM